MTIPRNIKELVDHKITFATYDDNGCLHLRLDNDANIFVDDGIGGPVTVYVIDTTKSQHLTPLEDQ